MSKERLDKILVERGLVETRERAKALIMEGKVFVNGQKEDKAGTFFGTEKIKDIDVRAEALKYVSRGGLKLEKAVDIWELDFEGYICLDIGASSGGFTDVMLQNGAKRVYSVDVGYGQLDYRLRSDERVVCMEKTNFRHSKAGDFPEKMDFAAADVSFISLSRMLVPAHEILKENANMVCLIKPQFEAGREHVGKNGVVRDPEIHEEVIKRVCGFCVEYGFNCAGLDFSPIKGPKGNIEYLLLLENRQGEAIPVSRIKEVVEKAHYSENV